MNSDQMIELNDLDGHDVYSRFGVCRSITRQFLATKLADSPRLLKLKGELMLNMGLLRLAHLSCDADLDGEGTEHYIEDYKRYNQWCLDTLQYMETRISEALYPPGSFHKENKQQEALVASYGYLKENFNEYMENHNDRRNVEEVE